jgi:hypothetical protein
MSDRRRGLRTRDLRPAKITFHDSAPAIDCIIRDLSLTGACLLVVNPVDIPNTFDLVLTRDQSRHPCQVIWRKTNQIGVAFQQSSSV